jgi:MFS family permease
VVFVSLRHSALAAPAVENENPVTIRVAWRHPAYRAALVSNFATGWSAFGLRVALVPLFVTEVMHRSSAMAGAALATFAVGNVVAVIPSGGLSDRTGRRPLLIIGLAVAGVSTAIVGLTPSLPLFLICAFIAGAASGVFSSPQQAAVADIIGNKARGGTAVATFQMMSDLGSIAGSLGVGEVAQHLSFGWAFGLSGVMLLVAAVAWACAPETRTRVA